MGKAKRTPEELKKIRSEAAKRAAETRRRIAEAKDADREDTYRVRDLSEFATGVMRKGRARFSWRGYRKVPGEPKSPRSPSFEIWIHKSRSYSAHENFDLVDVELDLETARHLAEDLRQFCFEKMIEAVEEHKLEELRSAYARVRQNKRGKVTIVCEDL